jgi:hypothetical protein
VYIDSFLSVAVARINEKIEAAKDLVASGSIGSMEDYKALTGKINAHRDDIELLKELFAQFFETRTIYSRRDEDGDREKTTY